jgi:hypothetical protein
LLAVSRVTAFLLYVPIVFTFLTGCHSLLTALRSTALSVFLSLERFQHDLHFFAGRLFLAYAGLHTIGHLIRWGLRSELSMLVDSQVGLTGTTAMLALMAVCAAHSKLRIIKFFKWSWETRMNVHYLFIVLVAACVFHTPGILRLPAVVLVAIGFWCVDKTFTWVRDPVIE